MRRALGSQVVRGGRAALLALLLAGCGRPEDEAWLRFLGFQTTSDDTTASLTVVNGNLNDGATDSADAVFQNASTTLGATDGETGVGIRVNRARVEYKMSGYAPPADEHSVNLYLAASTVADGTAELTEGTIADFPLVPSTLKQWLMETHGFDDAASTPTVKLTVKVTFYAEADDGTDLDVSTSIPVVLTNGGSEAKPGTVSIAATENVSGAGSSYAGSFTVTRTGPTTYALIVSYTVGGTAEAGTDYAELDGHVTIAAGESTATITVTALTDYTAGRTVVVTLTSGSGYTLGSGKKATVTLTE